MAWINRMLAGALVLSCVRLRDCRRGQDLVEYALLAGFVAVAAAAAIPYAIAAPLRSIYEAAMSLLRYSGG